MRITEKIENGFYTLKKEQEIYGEENGIRLVQVVGQLEDAKEKYGIDPLLLLEALSSGIYRFMPSGDIKYFDQCRFWLTETAYGYAFLCNGWLTHLDDYGNKKPGGWALTREELE